MTTNTRLLCRFIGAIMLLAVQIVAQENVDGYNNLGRGSCQDVRGKQFSYLQRVMTFPNAETCGRQECERFGNMEGYRGFEFSVTKRCTCLFDIDEIPVVPNQEDAPQYVSKGDAGNGAVAATSRTPGANCYQFGRNAGVMTGGMTAMLVVSASIFMML